MNINVNFHNSILINENIYIDPLNVNGENKVDYIFITHSHWDHYSIDDIQKILKPTSLIICPEIMKEEVCLKFNNCYFVEPDKSYDLGDIKFETFLSYNINKPFHQKTNNWVGFTIEIEGQKVTIVGDSDNTPELNCIKTDILLLPIGGIYTMNVEEAAKLTNTIMPKKVIPTHYGEIVGDKIMGEQFKSLIKKEIICEVQL